jgi:hypothetical protein
MALTVQAARRAGKIFWASGIGCGCWGNSSLTEWVCDAAGPHSLKSFSGQTSGVLLSQVYHVEHWPHHALRFFGFAYAVVALLAAAAAAGG